MHGGEVAKEETGKAERETNFKSPFRRTAKSERFLIKFFAPTKRTNDKWYATRILKSQAQITSQNGS
uniref:Uncharacterized protein n=1 Tax=Vespula pensylvanica TaxID=30213 RepID=A0A834PCI8_VESPE|nr:hypothetical protein H0235_003793 [Vespula pensylvanica]